MCWQKMLRRGCLEWRVPHPSISPYSTFFLAPARISHPSTKCSPDCSWFWFWQWQPGVFSSPILCGHFRCGPFSVTHQVQADIALWCHSSIPSPPPPLASTLTRLLHALRPAGVTTPSDSCPRIEASLQSLSASSLLLMTLCPFTQTTRVSLSFLLLSSVLQPRGVVRRVPDLAFSELRSPT